MPLGQSPRVGATSGRSVRKHYQWHQVQAGLVCRREVPAMDIETVLLQQFVLKLQVSRMSGLPAVMDTTEQ